MLSTGAVLALRVEDGSLVWQADVGPAGKSLSAPATDGERLFVGARDGLHALHLADGRQVWAFPTERRITAAPVVTGGVVYATCHDHHLYVLNAATGRELWRHEVGRRIEVSPVVAACGEPATSCVLVADRGGTLTAVACPFSAEEHEAAGHWIEAASAYAALGQIARGAQLLEAHSEPFKAAELWKAAGEQERAALQYEAARAWQQAAELWSVSGRPLRQAEALEQHARSLEDATCSAEERAAAWEASAGAFETEGETERAAACRQEVVRWLRQPIIVLDVQHEGLVLDAWSRLQFIVRNEGYGPARNLIIHASGDEFEGQVMTTHRIVTLRAGRERTEWLDVRPREYGDSVPLRVSVEYEGQAGEPCICEQTVYIPVARVESDRGAGQVFHITTAGGAVVIGDVAVEGDFVGGDRRTGLDQRGQKVRGPQTSIAGDARGPVLSGDFQGPVTADSPSRAGERQERETVSLRRQLAEARENLLLIRERKSQYVMETDVPLQLIREERRLHERIAELERKLNELERTPPPLPS